MKRSAKYLLLAALVAWVFVCTGTPCPARGGTEQEPEVDSLVEQLCSKYYYQREHALGELIRRGEAATPAMFAALKSDNYCVREAAVRFLEAVAEPETSPQLLDALKAGKEVEVVTGLMRLLARLECEDAIGHVRGLLSDESLKVRAAAVDALAALGDRDGIEEIRALVGDEFSEVRIAVVKALAAFRATESGKDVLALFKRERIPEVRRAAVECLGELKAEGAVPLLVEAVKDEDSPIFLQAVEALAKIGGDEAREALIGLLMRSEDLELLEVSSSAVGQVGESAIPVLEEKLEKLAQDADGRWKIMNAFGKMGKYVIPHFTRFLESETYPFYKDRASLMMLEVVKREYDITLDPKGYRLIYDEPFKEWERKIENWKKWWDEHKDD